MNFESNPRSSASEALRRKERSNVESRQTVAAQPVEAEAEWAPPAGPAAWALWAAAALQDWAG